MHPATGRHRLGLHLVLVYVLRLQSVSFVKSFLNLASACLPGGPNDAVKTPRNAAQSPSPASALRLLHAHATAIDLQVACSMVSIRPVKFALHTHLPS
jgi:hypothetical protein